MSITRDKIAEGGGGGEKQWILIEEALARSEGVFPLPPPRSFLRLSRLLPSFLGQLAKSAWCCLRPTLAPPRAPLRSPEDGGMSLNAALSAAAAAAFSTYHSHRRSRVREHSNVGRKTLNRLLPARREGRLKLYSAAERHSSQAGCGGCNYDYRGMYYV